MTVAITPVDVFTAAINIPADGEAVNSAAHALAAQPLANRTENNNSRLGDVPNLNNQTTLYLPIYSGVQQGATGVAWAAGANGMLNRIAVASAETWRIGLELHLPVVGSTIDTITANVNGGAGHGGLPVTLPRLQLVRRPAVTGLQTVLSVLTDTSGTVGAYEVDHTIVLSPAHVILAANVYSIEIRGENGTNSIDAQFALHSIEIAWTL